MVSFAVLLYSSLKYSECYEMNICPSCCVKRVLPLIFISPVSAKTIRLGTFAPLEAW